MAKKITSQTGTKISIRFHTCSAVLKSNSFNELSIEISMSNIKHSSTNVSNNIFKIVHLDAEILW